MPVFYRGIETEHWPEIGLSFNVFYKKKLLLLKTKAVLDKVFKNR